MNAPESPKAAAVSTHVHASGGGFILGLTAYALWGVLPVYFKALSSVAAVDIVAHRVLWSLPFLALLIAVTRGWDKIARRGEPAADARHPRRSPRFLIGFNWLLYVYAVTSGHILAASFGYYLNPLANVLLGRFVLAREAGAAAMDRGRDRRRRDQRPCRRSALAAVAEPRACASASRSTACSARSSPPTRSRALRSRPLSSSRSPSPGSAGRRSPRSRYSA